MNPSTGRTAPHVLGIDPGSVDTGLVVRCGLDVLAHVTVHRDRDEDADDGTRGVGVGPIYLGAIAETARQLVHEHAVEHVGAESVVAPNPHVRRRDGDSKINPAAVIAAGLVLGHLLAVWPNLVRVPPGRNGSSPLSAYPLVLVSDRERALGLNRIGKGGKLRHVRSAYDVAGSTIPLARQRASLHAAQRAS
ncbi:hypothetical protein [Jiangella muralis]|uniref:hypothetical protein n=1 Tax=Jiangella muralis TaxID=702383 RepID=UPI00069D9ECF|nr:hypothetical protein [Jiangella muralis]